MIKNFIIFLLMISLTSCSTSIPHYAPVVDGWKTRVGRSSDYIVRKEDTIYSIAWAFNIDYRDLAEINHLHHYQIYVGQRLQMVSTYQKLSPSTPNIVRSHKSEPSHPHYRTTSIENWRWPAHGKVVKGYSPRLGGNRGINIAGYYGEPILAAAPGTVVYSGSRLQGYGKLIILKHNASYLSAYAFNKAILVKEGQYVKAGQQIAEMGKDTTGKVLLHFEIRENGKAVNPRHYLTS